MDVGRSPCSAPFPGLLWVNSLFSLSLGFLVFKLYYLPQLNEIMQLKHALWELEVHKVAVKC